MPTLPWKTLNELNDEKKYKVMLTHLPLRHYRDSIRFIKYVNEIMAQLKQTEGIIGFSLKAHPLSKDYWTVSVWEDDESISKYVQTSPHSQIMKKMQGAMGKTAFTTWEVNTNEIPIDWTTALTHLTKS
jgi:quinol monooxygenase YgiN